jgi:hypothetical protein
MIGREMTTVRAGGGSRTRQELAAFPLQKQPAGAFGEGSRRLFFPCINRWSRRWSSPHFASRKRSARRTKKLTPTGSALSLKS